MISARLPLRADAYDRALRDHESDGPRRPGDRRGGGMTGAEPREEQRFGLTSYTATKYLFIFYERTNKKKKRVMTTTRTTQTAATLRKMEVEAIWLLSLLDFQVQQVVQALNSAICHREMDTIAKLKPPELLTMARYLGVHLSTFTQPF